MREAPTVSSWSRYAARTEGLIRKTTWLRMVETVENKTVRVYCFWAVRANQASSWAAPRTRSRVPRTITEMGLFSTKRSNTLPSMVASFRVSVSKARSVAEGEREDHLNRAAFLDITIGLLVGTKPHAYFVVDHITNVLNWYKESYP